MLPLGEILDRLADVYGQLALPRPTSLLDLVLFENVAYLVSDDRREQAFSALQREIGTRPEQILAASDMDLMAVAGRGILPAHQAGKLKAIARLAQDVPGGDLEALRDQPLSVAKKALMRFPSIGEPGAEKILLFGRSHAVLGLDSNGVRVLCRLGLVREEKSYAATYRHVQHFVQPYQSEGFDWLIRAHQLLRHHAQHLCRRTSPHCEQCPLTDTCAFYLRGSGSFPPSPT